MKNFSKYLSVAALCVAAIQADNNNDCGVSPTFVARSQARYKMREDVGVVDQTNLYDMESWYGTFAIIPGYMQSFRPSSIGRTLFGNSFQNTVANNVSNNCNTDCNSDCGTKILVQGSQVGNRTTGAWLADNFYLAPDYNGSFTVSPKVKDFFIDFDYFMGLDEWMCGMYFRVYAPFVHTRWDLDFCEQVGTNTLGYEEGYFASTAVAKSNLVESFGAYAGGLTPNLGSDITAQPLRFAKITNCARTKNGLGDLRAELGWNFWQDECYHLGLNIQAAAPTGTKRKAQYLFDAVVGNGKHWELGGGLTGHYTFWSDDAESKNFGFYVDANITTLFKAREERTFDLKGKPNSRYMLAAQFTENTDDLLTGNGTAANGVFNDVYAPVANLTTFDIKVSTGVQADVVAWFNYTSCGWSWDFGYNFYGRSKEKFDCETNSCDTKCDNVSNICDPINKDTWVLKGDARVYGFQSNDTARALSASESLATICKGTNGTQVANQSVDAPQLAVYDGNNLFIDTLGVTRINTSIQPVYIKCEDVDFARTRSITNTVFTHVSYTWDRECWVPYFGIGGFAEFGKNCGGCDTGCNTNDGCTNTNTNCNTSSSCNDCGSDGSSVDTSLSRWGIWLKGGVSFN